MHIVRHYHSLSHQLRYQAAVSLIPALILVVTVALTACGTTGAGGASVTGTIAGTVVAGPTCPAEPSNGSCANRPVGNRQVKILSPAAATASAGANATPPPGGVVATTTTDANGKFSVKVPPGQYVVRAATGPGMLGLRQITSGEVTVTADQTTTVQIVLDTGIR